MTDRAMVSFASLVLKRDNLLVLPVFDHLGRYLRPVNRAAVRHLIAVGEHEHIA